MAFHFTKILQLSLEAPFQKKSRIIVSNFFKIFNVLKDYKEINGILNKITLARVRLPPLERKKLPQPICLELIFSSTGAQKKKKKKRIIVAADLRFKFGFNHIFEMFEKNLTSDLLSLNRP